ncbi:MAG: hypothetical protein AXA67_10850 [Methylothermaceae bacteria B42]|nr:MAG: hypothetical protein AXA67_10850 [Methylothermaceae bacteria B42]
MKDPRHWQILVLSGLLTYAVGWLGISGIGWVSLSYPLGALAFQWGFSRWARIPFDPRSALISSFSLILLLHTHSLGWAVLAAGIAIGSKFLLRVDGRHLFNPTNLAIVIVLLLTDRAWLSPGQWGQGTFLGFAAVCAGLWVLHHTRRGDVTVAFGVAWMALIFGRAQWLGDPWSIPWLQLQNVSLLIFAFFMISDPMTLPDRRLARIGFALLVAGVGYVLQYHFYINEGPFYALAACAPLVPLLNRRWPGERYKWPGLFHQEVIL